MLTAHHGSLSGQGSLETIAVGSRPELFLTLISRVSGGWSTRRLTPSDGLAFRLTPSFLGCS